VRLKVSGLESPRPDDQPVEIVERKGLGHPDTICDALAEQFSLALSRFYIERFGMVLHHNVDKVLLRGGASRPAFGGGEVLEPIEIYLAGRATQAYRGVPVPVERLARTATHDWLRTHLPELDPDRNVRVRVLVRPGSAELVDLYDQQRHTGVRLANDTSCGAGFAPLSETERLTLEVERELTSPATRSRHPEIGPDVKVMAVRHDGGVELTIGCALVDRHVRDIDDYLAKRSNVVRIAREVARWHTQLPVEVTVNAADAPESESLFLTVTGTSAEAGDDGEAGRGNRANGLITPYRPMTLESLAGKNPVTHVGKLYNLAAALIATDVAANVADVQDAECYLVSRIGGCIDDPQVVDVRVRSDGRPAAELEREIDVIVREHLAAIEAYAERLLDGSLAFNRWPLGSG
jgi:S-adenosylmethionine synthetase